MRTFVALNLSPETRAALYDAAAPLRAALDRSVSWTREPALHLTLKFLGERSAEFAKRLADELAPRVTGTGHLRLVFDRIGWFPALGHLRVLWFGVESNAALNELYQHVELACLVLRVPRESRPFHPHVTIGRIRQGTHVDRAPIVREATTVRHEIREHVRTLDVMESVLGQGGARYRVVHAVPLDQKNSEA